MIMYPRIKGLLVGVALASTAAASAHAQENATRQAPADSSPLMKSLEREIAPMVVDYWEAKLNGYRSTIDGFLPATDLAELNRLRVQWGISLASGGKGEDGHMTMRSSVHIDTAEGKSEVKISVMGKAPAEAEAYMQEHPDAALEFLGARDRVVAIAERNRARFDGLAERVSGDIFEFIGVMRDRMVRFAADHRAELESSVKGREFLEGVKRTDEKLKDLSSGESRQTLATIYRMVIEPMVMLYDGGGVKGFFEQAGPVASVMPGWALEDRSALVSCAPNPASTGATVSYRLAEPSRKTLLKLFDARGEEVGSYDLGERPSGDGSVAINVAGLAPGTYLYRLTAATSKGEQVFSKTMQVVR
jgi:hypothetical protein